MKTHPPRHHASLSLVLLAVAVIPGACANQPAAGPPQIIEGRSLCTECHMTIDDIRFAAAYRLADGTERVFDDIGEMATHSITEPEVQTTSIWVFDYSTREPIPATKAWFVHSQNLVSPMASGFAAHSSLTAAKKAATTHEATVMNWTDLIDQLAAHTSTAHHPKNTETRK